MEKNQQQEHEGDKYLRILGLSDLAENHIELKDGRHIYARDFLDVCGEHALPALKGFESMDTLDPNYGPTLDALQKYVTKFIVGTDEA